MKLESKIKLSLETFEQG